MRTVDQDAIFASAARRFLIVPGLHNSGPEHWQSRWERSFPDFARVEQNDWQNPVCDDWIRAIDKALTEGPIDRTLLVAHSLGCVTVAHWARVFVRNIQGALLVAPVDVDATSFPSGTVGFTPMPLIPLRFRSTVIASSNDPFLSIERAKVFACCWGSEFRRFDNLGHINASSNLGQWAEGLALLRALARQEQASQADIQNYADGHEAEAG